MSEKTFEELNELDEEQLDNVNGGFSYEESRAKYLPSDHGPLIPIASYSNSIGKKVYVVLFVRPQQYYWGTLVRTGIKPFYCLDVQVNTVLLEGKSEQADLDYNLGASEDFLYGNWVLYEYKANGASGN